MDEVSCNKYLEKENKAIAHIVVALTFLVFLGLFKPLISQINLFPKGSLLILSGLDYNF